MFLDSVPVGGDGDKVQLFCLSQVSRGEYSQRLRGQGHLVHLFSRVQEELEFRMSLGCLLDA